MLGAGWPAMAAASETTTHLVWVPFTGKVHAWQTFDADATGVYYANGRAVVHHRLDNASEAVLACGCLGVVALDDGSWLTREPEWNVVVLGRDGRAPVALGPVLLYEVASDGELVQVASRGVGSLVLERVDPATHEVTKVERLAQEVRDLEIAPDGSIHVVMHGSVRRFDGVANETFYSPPVNHSVGQIAFDAQGRLYTTETFFRSSAPPSSLLARYDPTTGAREVLASDIPQLLGLEFGGTKLYGYAGDQRFGYFETGVAGFEGFDDLTPPGPVPDIEISVRVERGPNFMGTAVRNPVNDVRDIVVTIRNVGEAPLMDAFFVDVWAHPHTVPVRGGEWWSIWHDIDLSPGESREHRISWDTTRLLGSYDITARADAYPQYVLESEERLNNEAYTESVVRVDV